MVVEQLQVELDAIQGVDLGLQLVVAREKFRSKSADHALQLGLELRHVHQLAQLLGQRELLELAIDLLGHGPLARQVHAVLAAVPGGHGPQMLEVAQPHARHRLVAPVDSKVDHLPADGGLVDAEVVGYFLLCRHGAYDPLAILETRQERGSWRPLSQIAKKDPRISTGEAFDLVGQALLEGRVDERIELTLQPCIDECPAYAGPVQLAYGVGLPPTHAALLVRA